MQIADSKQTKFFDIMGLGYTYTICDHSHAFIGGGQGHGVSVPFGSVLGGCVNIVNADYGFIGGGGTNTVQAGYQYGVIGGGFNNYVCANHSSILGGYTNQVLSPWSPVPPDVPKGIRWY